MEDKLNAMKILAERIAARRREKNLTQAELGRIVNLSAQAIYRLEKVQNKRYSPDVLKDLSSALDCTEDYLLGKTRDPDRTADGYIPLFQKGAGGIRDMSTVEHKVFEANNKLGLLLFQCLQVLNPDDPAVIARILNAFLNDAKSKNKA